MSELPSVSFRSARRRAFSVVLAIELWERFGYYGMQAVLTLFMVQHLHMCDKDINAMQGALGLLICALPVLGGVVGDQLLGTRPTLVSGAVGLTIGYGLLAASLYRPVLFFPSLALIALAGGLFKPNAGALVKQIYAGDGTALDAAFTLYYMSVNVGSTISMLSVPWLQVQYGFAIAFGLCACGLLCGLVYYGFCARWIDTFFTQHQQSNKLYALNKEKFKINKLSYIIIFTFLILWSLLTYILINTYLILFFVISVSISLCVLWIWFYVRASPHERPGLLLSYLLSFQTMAYLIFYQQQQTSLTLFALRAVSGDYWIGTWKIFTMSAGQFQALNPIWIMVMSPVLAWSYQRAARGGREVSFPMKILLGYVCAGFACFLLWWSSQTTQGLVSPWIMVVVYGAMSLGELLTMGLGLAIIARYAPARANALLMGSLYLLWGIGMYGGGLVANLAVFPTSVHHLSKALFYVPLFKKLAVGAVLMCCVLVGLFPFVRRLEQLHLKRI